MHCYSTLHFGVKSAPLIVTEKNSMNCYNYYTEAYTVALSAVRSERIGVLERLIHINGSSDPDLRQRNDHIGEQCNA